jgi:hypothetical protein
MVWRPEIAAGGCIFLKFLRLTPKRGEGKQINIIDRVGGLGGGHTPKAVAVPTCSAQWPSQVTVAVPSGRASGRPPTRNPPHVSTHCFFHYYYYLELAPAHRRARRHARPEERRARQPPPAAAVGLGWVVGRTAQMGCWCDMGTCGEAGPGRAGSAVGRAHPSQARRRGWRQFAGGDNLLVETTRVETICYQEFASWKVLFGK